MHGYGTNLGKFFSECWRSCFLIISLPSEGPWSEVVKAIHDCHAAVHAKGAPRVATDIRIGTRTDRSITPGTGNEGKVQRVEAILAQDRKE